jgi:hypothetical protein
LGYGLLTTFLVFSIASNSWGSVQYVHSGALNGFAFYRVNTRLSLFERRWLSGVCIVTRFCRMSSYAKHNFPGSGNTGQGQTPQGACQLAEWLSNARRKFAGFFFMF